MGTATEQGAGYAADGYARLQGLGALVTTFGVGELSAMNAIAGAHAESVPVVHIVGTPPLSAQQARKLLHHNLPGSDFGHFMRMAAEITAYQADLRVATAPAQIDEALRTALRTSRPVYLAVPADVARAVVPRSQFSAAGAPARGRLRPGHFERVHRARPAPICVGPERRACCSGTCGPLRRYPRGARTGPRRRPRRDRAVDGQRRLS